MSDSFLLLTGAKEFNNDLMTEERNYFKENKCNVLQKSENLIALGLEREDVPWW